jgi:hypothetical protein
VKAPGSLKHLELSGRVDHGSSATAIVAQDVGPRRINCSLADVGRLPDGAIVSVSGRVVDLTIVYTRAGDPVGFATLTDGEVHINVLLFCSALEQAGFGHLPWLA